MTTVILAMSPRAAQALEGFILKGGTRPPVIDEVLAELGSQLTAATERDAAATAWRSPVAERVAEQMARAGAAAVTPEAKEPT